MGPRILLTGGSGRLGTALRALVDCIAPSHAEMDITDLNSCRDVRLTLQPDLVIHAAALADAVTCERERKRCWDINVRGTANMLRAFSGIRFVHISTDYVFSGDEGNYSEEDLPNPVNFYGLSKLASEVAAAQYPKALILRAPFRSDPPWRYDRAFVDQFTSCDFVSERAPQILEAALSFAVGILHIGGPRRSIFELAREAGPPDVGRMFRCEFGGLRLPRDTSLNSDKKNASNLQRGEKRRKENLSVPCCDSLEESGEPGPLRPGDLRA
jgi:dTDP-4-dehydrorhamnose reductase